MTIDVAAFGTQYTNWSANEGQVAGNGGSVEISFEDGILTFTEADGDKYEVNAAGVTEADLEALAKEIGATVAGTKETEETTATTAADDADLDANKEKKAELQAQWDALNSSAETIKETVEKLSEEIKKSLEETLDEQKEITEEEQERVKELVSTQIEQFKKDKENGKDVKLSDLQANIQAGLSEGGFDEEMSALLSDLVITNTKMVTMDGLLSELGVISGQMKMLDTEMADLDKVIEEQEKAAEEAASSAANCNPCDPIGFKGEDGTTYEFVVDKDGNGELSNFSEFLGSENFFDEMVALDADGSGDVTNDELNDAGVMVLVKDANGNQELKSIEEAFDGEDVNVNLGSYQEAEEGALAENGQTLLGNFDISVGDDTFEGYSTLDSAEYLEANYTFTDENPNNLAQVGADDAVVDEQEAAEGDLDRAKVTEDIDKFIEEYEAKLSEYEAQFENITELMGLDDELIATIHEFAETQGAAAAQTIIKEAEAADAKEAEEAQKEDEAEAVEGAQNAENEEAEEEKEEEQAA